MLKRIDFHSVGIENLKYVTLSERSYNIYIPLADQYVCAGYAAGEITDPKIVKNILNSLFDFYTEKLEQLIGQNKSLGFLFFVHNIHESCIVIRYQNNRNDPDVKKYFTEEERHLFPIMERIIRIVIENILEEKFSTSITDDFLNNCTDDPYYVNILEDILLIGKQITDLKEIISRLNRFEKAVTIVITQEGEIKYSYPEPYNSLFYILTRWVSGGNNNFYDVVRDSLENSLMSVFGNNLKMFLNSVRGGSVIFRKKDFIKYRVHVLGREKADLFYGGLTLTSKNKLPLKESFRRMQEGNRFTYRPILEFKDSNSDVCWLLGYFAAHESVRQLFLFGLLWKRIPVEWKSQNGMRILLDWADEHREKIMISILVDALKENKISYDVNIKYFINEKGQGVTIREKPGEIDILFLDDKNKIIYVCECKNSLPRTELIYWLSEYKQIEEKFEVKLSKKLNWVKLNRQLIKNHFSKKLKIDVDLSGWRVEAMFIFMTPSLYMYDSSFKAMSTIDFIEFLKNDFFHEYPDLNAELADGTPYKISYPYLKSLDRLIEDGIL